NSSGIKGVGQRGDTTDADRALPIATRADRDDPQMDASFKVIGQRLEPPPRNPVDKPSLKSDLPYSFFGWFGARAGTRQRPASLGQFALKPPALLDDAGDPSRKFGSAGPQRCCRLTQNFFFSLNKGFSRGSSQRLDAAHPGGDRRFPDNLEQPDIAGTANMCAPAELDRKGPVFIGLPAHRDDPDLVAVFLAEQRQRAFGYCVVGRQETSAH